MDLDQREAKVKRETLSLKMMRFLTKRKRQLVWMIARRERDLRRTERRMKMRLNTLKKTKQR